MNQRNKKFAAEVHLLGTAKATHLKVYDYQNMSLMKIPIEMPKEGEVGRELVG